MWAIFGGLYLASLIAFFLIDGKEVVYFMYILLDIFMTASLATHYFVLKKRDKKAKELQSVIRAHSRGRSMDANDTPSSGGESLITT